MKNLINKLAGSCTLKISRGLFILLFVIGWINLEAQPVFTIYSDVAKNTVSDGVYIKSAFLGNYRLEKYLFKAALQTNLINNNNIALSGYRIDGSREFNLKKALIELNGFGLWTTHTGILKETNFGCVMAMKTSHFDVQLGTNFRTFSFRKDAIEKYEIENEATKIRENFNLMYSFGYNLKPSNHRWNAGLTFTNTDNFMINQETNPYVNLKGFFKISSPVRLFAEVWYKTTGAINMSSNYFGFLMRGGIVWNFN